MPVGGLASPPVGAPPRGALPNLVVIGAQKCGTSSLHHYLALHPEVSMSTPKELDFFLAGQSARHDLNWYAAHFDATAPVRGESSPNYTAWPHHRGVPERMAAVLPGVRLVYLVRDPVARIGAQYVHNVARGRAGADLRATLLAPGTTYVARSRYFAQLERFLDRFPAERVLVVDQLDLRDRRAETLRSVFEFVGVDGGFTHPDFAAERHPTATKRRPTPAGRAVGRVAGTPAGRMVPRRAWDALARAPLLSAVIPPPAGVAEALGDAVLGELHADAERLRAHTGCTFAGWVV